MDFYDCVESRRSIRGFAPDPVPEEALQRIARAVYTAPSACNFQPVRFLLIRSGAVRAKLNGAFKHPFTQSAPCVLAAVGSDDKCWHRPQDGFSSLEMDCGIALEHAALAITAEGLGGCWIGAFDPELADAALNVVKPWRTLAMYVFGKPAVPPRPFTRPQNGETFFEVID